MSERDLRGLDDEALVEALLRLTRRVRVALAEGDQHTVRRAFEQVREAANAASHHRRDLLEVAEGFLRAVSSFPSGTRERALAAFVDDHPREAVEVLEAALHGSLRQGNVPEAVRGAVHTLVERGALRPTTEDRLDVPPALRGVVSDLVEPLPFRLWKRVEAAREGARLLATSSDAGAEHVARSLMVSKSQAQAHLLLHPIDVPTPRPIRPLRQREPLRRPPVTVRARVEALSEATLVAAPSEPTVGSVDNRTPNQEPRAQQAAGLV